MEIQRHLQSAVADKDTAFGVNSDVVCYTLYLNSGIFIILLTIYCVCHYKTIADRIYCPRKYLQGPDHIPFESKDRYLFSWVNDCFSVSTETIKRKIGLDALLFLRFERLCATSFCLSAIYGLAVLLPVNYTSHNDGVRDAFAKMSISNIPDKEGKLWWHVLGAYLFTSLACVLIWRQVVEGNLLYFIIFHYFILCLLIV